MSAANATGPAIAASTTISIACSSCNPILRSLRALQQASTRQNVQRKLGCTRASLGSLSEAVEVFDPARLCGIIESLAAEVKPVRDVRGGHFAQTLTAVDGSVVKTLKTIAEAAFMNDKNGGSHSGWRLHTHFDIDRHVPPPDRGQRRFRQRP